MYLELSDSVEVCNLQPQKTISCFNSDDDSYAITYPRIGYAIMIELISDWYHELSK